MHSTCEKDIVENAKATSAPIEIGLVVVGRLDRIDQAAIRAAREQVLFWLQGRFPNFDWRISLTQREEVPMSVRQEPAALLRDGSDLREAEGWDFAILFTAADLISRYKNYALAVTSSALDSAIISTNRIDPHTFDAEVEHDERHGLLINRIVTLCLRSIAHLNGLSASDDEHNLMHTPASSNALAAMAEFDEHQCEAMAQNLSKIADPRLEETQAKDLSSARFYATSVRINRHEIYDALLQAKPWEFPFRLLRLSAAAISTTLLLMLTAETWHLASEQSIAKLSILLMIVLAITTAFVAKRQGLLIQRRKLLKSEQTVITNMSAIAIVLIGLATTAALLIAINFLACYLLYPADLIAAWINVDIGQVVISHYWQTSLLISIFGLFIGAMGATFEEQNHFRHIVFVDEEI